MRKAVPSFWTLFSLIIGNIGITSATSTPTCFSSTLTPTFMTFQRIAQLFPSQAPVSTPHTSLTGFIQTVVSKLLFAVLTPFACLAGFGLLRSLREVGLGDLALTTYQFAGLLLWIALLVVTDAPGGGRIVTRIVWGLHAVFNILAIPFWISWERVPHTASFGFPGLGFLASFVVLPVLIISFTCLVLSFTNTKHTP
jgi:hypothetical protein